MANSNTRSGNVVQATMTPAQPGDCISDKMARELVRRLTLQVIETSTPGDAVVSRTPPDDTSKIWYPADENGFPIGTAYKFDPLQGQWISTAVVPQPPPCRSSDANSIIELDSQGCWIVRQEKIEQIAQSVGIQVSSDNDNAIQLGSDGGLYVEVVDVSEVGQVELLETPASIATATDSVGSTVFDLSTVVGVTVPAWATHAIIRAHCGVYTNNLAAANTAKSYVRVLLNGDIVARVGPAVAGNNTVDTFGDDTNDVHAALDDTNVTYQFTLNQSAGWGAQDSAAFDLTLIGFLRASTP